MEKIGHFPWGGSQNLVFYPDQLDSVTSCKTELVVTSVITKFYTFQKVAMGLMY